MKDLQDYLNLETQLFKIRYLNNNFDSAEEDRLLEEMDWLWLQLSDEEKAILNVRK